MTNTCMGYQSQAQGLGNLSLKELVRSPLVVIGGSHRVTEGLFYSLKVTTYLLQRVTALSDLIFDCYVGLYGYNDRVLLTESKFIPYTD